MRGVRGWVSGMMVSRVSLHTGVRSRGAGGALAPPSCQPSMPKPRKIFILLGLDIFRFVM